MGAWLAAEPGSGLARGASLHARAAAQSRTAARRRGMRIGYNPLAPDQESGDAVWKRASSGSTPDAGSPLLARESIRIGVMGTASSTWTTSAPPSFHPRPPGTIIADGETHCRRRTA